MSAGVIALILIEVALVGAALWSWRSSRRARMQEQMFNTLVEHLPRPQRLDDDPFEGVPRSGPLARIAHLFDGLDPKQVVAGGGAILAVATLVGLNGGAAQGLGALILGLSAGLLALLERRRRVQRRMRLQLPVFIDLLLRSLSAGKAVEFALRHAIWETQAPLRPVLDEVLRVIDAGGGLAQALHRAAARHELREFSLFALAVHISYNYGSNPKLLLENVSDMVRRDEQMRQELAAMTGETRLSAWVLGLLPVGVVSWLHLGNPNYIGGMLADPSGRWMLIAAIVLQVSGAFTLWRMMRSLG